MKTEQKFNTLIKNNVGQTFRFAFYLFYILCKVTAKGSLPLAKNLDLHYNYLIKMLKK